MKIKKKVGSKKKVDVKKKSWKGKNKLELKIVRSKKRKLEVKK